MFHASPYYAVLDESVIDGHATIIIPNGMLYAHTWAYDLETMKLSLQATFGLDTIFVPCPTPRDANRDPHTFFIPPKPKKRIKFIIKNKNPVSPRTPTATSTIG